MKAICSWSGGKDCCLALYKALSEGIEVPYLVNFINETVDKSLSHGADAELISLQSKAMGLQILQRQVARGSYEQVMKTIIQDVKQEGASAQIFGDIYLQEHKDWLDRVCSEAGITPIMPLWHQDTEQLMYDFISAGFEAIVISVKSDVMGQEWLGQRLDHGFVRRLREHTGKAPIDICGENGEYHTIVIDGPLFRSRLEVQTGDVVEDDGHFFLCLPQYKLATK